MCDLFVLRGAYCLALARGSVLHQPEAARTLSFSTSIILFLREGFDENVYTGYKIYSLAFH